MKVLVACEFSGVVRDAFRKRGFDAWSCDLLPAEDGSPYHYQCDVRTILNSGWELMIAHPPCTYLCVSGAGHFKKPGRMEKQDEALDFVRLLMNAPIPHIAIENPVGVISTKIKEASQYIQPYQFGHPETKKTGLWLKNLPKLQPANVVKGTTLFRHNTEPIKDRIFRMPPSKNRGLERSRTYAGIGEAMAIQWGDYIRNTPLQQC